MQELLIRFLVEGNVTSNYRTSVFSVACLRVDNRILTLVVFTAHERFANVDVEVCCIHATYRR